MAVVVVVVRGEVRSWNAEEGWGVVDSPETPGGCFRSAAAGQRVELEWEAAGQDGYPYRAARVWPAGTDPFEPPPAVAPDGAYRSELTITFDEDPQRD